MADERKYYVLCEQNCKFEGMTKEQILTAITQAVNEGTIGDIDTGFITTIKTINDKALKFFVGTQSEYEALTDAQKANVFALITNDTTKEALLESIRRLEEEKANTDDLRQMTYVHITDGANIRFVFSYVSSGNPTIQSYTDLLNSFKNSLTNGIIVPASGFYNDGLHGTACVYGVSLDEDSVDLLYYTDSGKGSIQLNYISNLEYSSKSINLCEVR